MKWLPSFVRLFLVFTAGLIPSVGGIIGEVQFFGNYTVGNVFMTLRLLGLLLLIGSPFLIALKFFAQLDAKSQPRSG